VAAFFFDSSALVKRYAQETGTGWIFSLVRPSAQNRLYLARITGVEVVAALTKRMRLGSLSANATAKAINRFEREFANRYLLVEVSPPIIKTTMTLAKSYTLRGYDAVQFASALQANADRIAVGATPLTFVSADIHLNSVATAEGLTVDNPNNH
jgi:predicted nucleic acid-binding protein